MAIPKSKGKEKKPKFLDKEYSTESTGTGEEVVSKVKKEVKKVVKKVKKTAKKVKKVVKTYSAEHKPKKKSSGKIKYPGMGS